MFKKKSTKFGTWAKQVFSNMYAYTTYNFPSTTYVFHFKTIYNKGVISNRYFKI